VAIIFIDVLASNPDEKCRLRVCESKAPRKILIPNSEQEGKIWKYCIMMNYSRVIVKAVKEMRMRLQSCNMLWGINLHCHFGLKSFMLRDYLTNLDVLTN
jgi:hypothetical protein